MKKICKIVLLGLLLQIGTGSLDLKAQDSLNMEKMAVLSGLGGPYNDVWGYTRGGNEYAILGSTTSINIIDVTDCSFPVLVNSWTDGGNKIWRDFKTYGDYIYGICDSCDEGLQTINKDTYAPSQSTAVFNSAHNIFIDESSGRLYVAGTNTLSRGLHVYDLTISPSNPPLLASIDFQDWDDVVEPFNWYVHDVYVKNDTAYCSHGWEGHAVWDMTDLSDVKQIGKRLSDPGYNHSSWIHESLPYEYVAREVPNGLPLQVYDNSDWTDIEVAGTFGHTIHETGANSSTSTPHNPFVHEGKLYVSNYHDGVKVYDLNDPTNPILQAYYDTYPTNNGSYGGYMGNWGVYPFLPSECILASDRSFGLYTLRLTERLTKNLTIENSDVLLDKTDSKIIFHSPNYSMFELKLKDSCLIGISSIVSSPTIHTQSENMTVSITKPGAKLYFRSSDDSLGYISVADDGSLVGPILTPGPTPTVDYVFENQDLVLSTFASDIKMVSPDGTCYRLTITDAGALDISLTDCD